MVTNDEEVAAAVAVDVGAGGVGAVGVGGVHAARTVPRKAVVAISLMRPQR